MGQIIAGKQTVPACQNSNCTVLVAEDDQLLRLAITEILSGEGMMVLGAADGKQALESFLENKPDIVVTDIRMPEMDGLELLQRIKKSGLSAPVIMMTGDPDLSSVIRALQEGAFDYIVKPLEFEVLKQKISAALEKNRLARENIILSEMVSLYTVTSKLAATHNLDALLDIIFRYGFELTGSQNGALFLKNGTEIEYVRQRGSTPLSEPREKPDQIRLGVAQACFSRGEPVIVEKGVSRGGVEIGESVRHVHAMLALPIRIEKELIGVLIVERGAERPVFSELDLNRMEILVSQAGIAVNNANLYSSLSQRLDELKLVSTFSETLMGRLDKYELVSSLFGKIREHCAADITGFLFAPKERPEFAYWARGIVSEPDLQALCRSIVDLFNGTTPEKIVASGVVMRQLRGQQKTNGTLSLPLGYTRFFPIHWEGRAMGMLLVGSKVKRDRNEESEDLVSGLVNQIRIALINVRLYDEMKENYLRTIKALAAAVDAKDNYTAGHSEKVMEIAEDLAREMDGFDSRRIAIIRDAALLHDIGKISIPGHILNKPGALTFQEFNNVVKGHSAIGANIIKDVPFLNDLYTLVLHHHEHYDGSGYPHGLKGDSIPIEARLLHVADAFDAMTSDRPYRKSLGIREAISRIVADSGKHFDPAVVEVFLRVVEKKGLVDQRDTNAVTV